jgi:hypothetical protein
MASEKVKRKIKNTFDAKYIFPKKECHLRDKYRKYSQVRNVNETVNDQNIM